MAYGAPGASTRAKSQTARSAWTTSARPPARRTRVTRQPATTGRAESSPGLIRGVETAARSVGAASPDVCVLVYDTTAALLSRVGEPFLAWAAADRARSAAEYADDPLLAAVSAWRLSYMITGRKHPQEAPGLAMIATAALERAMRAPSPEQLSVYAPCTWLPPRQRRRATTGRRRKQYWPRPAASATVPAKQTIWARRSVRSMSRSTPSRRRCGSATPHGDRDRRGARHRRDARRPDRPTHPGEP
jgi:hypothetical protein